MTRPLQPPPGLAVDPTAFIAIDVETANKDAGSICQIGFARFAGGELIDNWSWLVHPQTYFSDFNIGIHGIRPMDVSHAPDWKGVHGAVADLLADQVVVSHTAFDITALTRASEAHDRAPIGARWLDSVRVARRAFPQFRQQGGYGLANLRHHLTLDFAHHDSGEDARAAGWVIQAAVSATGLSVADWVTAAHRPVAGFSAAAMGQPGAV